MEFASLEEPKERLKDMGGHRGLARKPGISDLHDDGAIVRDHPAEKRRELREPADVSLSLEVAIALLGVQWKRWGRECELHLSLPSAQGPSPEDLR